MNPDKTAIACNIEGDSMCADGALAYVSGSIRRSRMRVRAKSRSGRWITRYADVAKLSNFRFKTIPELHPRYADQDINWQLMANELDALATCEFERQQK